MICQLRDASERLIDAAQDRVELEAGDDDEKPVDNSDAIYEAWSDTQENS